MDSRGSSITRSAGSEEALLPLADYTSEKDHHDLHHHRNRRSLFYSLLSPSGSTSPGRRLLLKSFAILSVVSLFALVCYSLVTSRLHPTTTSTPSWNQDSHLVELCANLADTNPLDALPSDQPATVPPAVIPTPEETWDAHPLNSKNFLRGPPTLSFRDNLRDDTKYITSWPAAGWTNDVMTMANLLYLALITDRVPIMPKFTPSHIGGNVPPIAFGDVFDVQQLSEGMGVPILEWHEVKAEDSTYLDDMSCWNLWEAVQDREHHPRNSASPQWIQADVSYTRAPSWIKLIPNYEHDQHATFWAVATLAYPDIRNKSLEGVDPLPSPLRGVQAPPDEHLLCYDYLYYLCAQQPWEWEYDYSPAWKNVARHMRWSQSLSQIADGHIRRALGIADNQRTPAWISLHVRHHDFAVYCTGMATEDCFAPLSVYERRVREIRQELWERKGLDIQHVIMTSDEQDPEWWADVEALGWKHIDFVAERTEEIYGKWYPVLIDAFIQSMGQGFVGTDRSTMSVIARRRVDDWDQGVTRMVKWGSPGADDH